jgi:hypothetical protein
VYRGRPLGSCRVGCCCFQSNASIQVTPNFVLTSMCPFVSLLCWLEDIESWFMSLLASTYELNQKEANL